MDADSIYQIPRYLFDWKLDQFVVERFLLDCPPADLSEWDQVVENQRRSTTPVTIAMVGKYMELLDAYKSLNEALSHAGIQNLAKVNIRYIDSEDLCDDMSLLNDCHGILVPGGFGERGVEGKIRAVQYAREENIPYLGICLGMQVAVIEYARNMAGLENANSPEFDTNTPYPVIGLITEWLDNSGKRELRTEDSDLGGTMRLGAQDSHLAAGSMAQEIYGSDIICERHRHRYEVNNNFIDQIQAAGLKVGGWSGDDSLVETVELSEHRWFFACQFHPEFTSTPRGGHPLFTGFVKAALDYSQES
jgi:CTP synthase